MHCIKRVQKNKRDKFGGDRLKKSFIMGVAGIVLKKISKTLLK